MESSKSKMDFQEADRRYAELKRQHDAGTIDDAEFDTRLKELMVRDDEDRWWVKSRKTGEWHYNDGNAWVRGTPPGYQTPPPEQPERGTPEQPPVQGRQGGPIQGRWAIWAAVLAVVVLVVGIGLYLITRSSSPEAPPLAGSGDDGGGQGAAMVQVPNVLDKPPAEARETLGNDGFETKIEPERWATEWPEGVMVTEQSPLEGEKERGSAVTVTLDYPMVQVPSVLDQPPAEAKETLGSEGFEVKVEPEQWATEWPEGVIVVEQTPLEGEAKWGSAVTITLDYPAQPNQDYQPDSSY